MSDINKITSPEIERIFAQLCGNISRELNRAMRKEYMLSGLTFCDFVREIGLSSSFVKDKLDGDNMDLRTIAIFLAAIGYEMEIELKRIKAP